MAISYVGPANITDNWSYYPNQHKFLTITGCEVGDLIVICGVGDQGQGTNANHDITTTSGTTSAWTRTAGYSASAYNDADTHAGWATVSAAGSVTVRVQLNLPDINYDGGVFAYLIPAAEWTGTPSFTHITGGDADAQIGMTLSAYSSVLVFGGSRTWTGGNPANGSATPTGTVDSTFQGAGNNEIYTYCAHWTGQAAGTRNYGVTGISGGDWALVGVEIPDPNAPPSAAPVTYVKRVVIG